MKRALKILGGVVLVLAAGIGGGYWWLSRPIDPIAFQEPGPTLEARQKASIVDTVLAHYGVTDAAFVPGDDGAFVGYNAPAGVDADELQFAAMMALASAAPDPSWGTAVLHEADAPKLAWSGDLDALRAAGEDADALAAWLGSVEKTPL